jgi:hypothetical protein
VLGFNGLAADIPTTLAQFLNPRRSGRAGTVKLRRYSGDWVQRGSTSCRGGRAQAGHVEARSYSLEVNAPSSRRDDGLDIYRSAKPSGG